MHNAEFNADAKNTWNVFNIHLAIRTKKCYNKLYSGYTTEVYPKAAGYTFLLMYAEKRSTKRSAS